MQAQIGAILNKAVGHTAIAVVVGCCRARNIGTRIGQGDISGIQIGTIRVDQVVLGAVEHCCRLVGKHIGHTFDLNTGIVQDVGAL